MIKSLSVTLGSILVRIKIQLTKVILFMCCNALFLTITEENSPKQVDDLGSQFTEIFIKQQENVTLLLTLVEVSNTLVLGILKDM